MKYTRQILPKKIYAALCKTESKLKMSLLCPYLPKIKLQTRLFLFFYLFALALPAQFEQQGQKGAAEGQHNRAAYQMAYMPFAEQSTKKRSNTSSNLLLKEESLQIMPDWS